MFRKPVPVLYVADRTVGRMPSMTVMCWSGAADMPLLDRSATASAVMSSCGAAIPLTVPRCASERVSVVEEESTARVVTSPSERPPVEWPASRTAILP